MVKRKGPTWDFFKTKNKGVECKYCSKEYKHANVNKMEKHIKKCFKCPADLKKVLDSSDKVKLFKSIIPAPLTPKKNTDKSLSVTVSNMEDLEAGPSSSSSNNPSKNPSRNSISNSDSESSLFPGNTIIQPSPSSQLLSFVDHMDAQTNVSSF